MSRLDDLMTFYQVLALLEQRLGGKRLLRECNGHQGWPQRGIYFFFEPGEFRSPSDMGPRVVRVGTHALKAGSKSSLWRRLSQHKGVLHSGGGNHRGSIFRLLTGQALIARDSLNIPTWSIGGDIGKAAHDQDMKREQVKLLELPVEKAVSESIGIMELLWLSVDDDPGSDSLRGYLERNAIALLSNYRKDPIDPPSSNWLGLFSDREKVRESGLWNSNHVSEDYDPEFLGKLKNKIDKATTNPI